MFQAVKLSLRGAAVLLAWLLWAATAAVGGDCNTNGVDDSTDIGTGSSEDCNDNGLPDECESLPVHFVSRDLTTPLENTPELLVLGDLDRDGKADAVTANGDGEGFSLSLLFGSGDGAFGRVLHYRVPAEVTSVGLRDFDVDGDLDVQTLGPDSVSVYLNDGDGTLAEPTRSPVEADARQSVATDVNGDGFPDVVLLHRRAATLSIYPSAGGKGALGQPLVLNTEGDGPESFIAADLNFDGAVDLAAVNRDSRDFSVFLNDGSGRFSAPTRYAVSGFRPNSVRAADADRDGSIDLLVVTRDAFVVLPNPGDGTFGEERLFPFSDTDDFVPLHVALGDFDRDGDEDVLLARTLKFRVIWNDAGRFQRFTETNPGVALTAIAADDVDDDRDLDLVLGTSNPTGLYTLFNEDESGLTVNARELSVADCGQINGCRPHGLTTADLDGDGDLDVLASLNFPAAFFAYLNESGALERQEIHRFGSGHAFSVRVGDLDLDGDVDAVTVTIDSDELFVHENRGNLAFKSPVAYRVGQQPRHVELVDIDGDGDLDAAVANTGQGSVSLLRNHGDGTFDREGMLEYRVGREPTALVTADLNGAGSPDVAVSNRDSGSVSVLLDWRDGTFGHRATYRLEDGPNHIVATDVDADLDEDLVTANLSAQSVSFLLNMGDGTFASERVLHLRTNPYSVALFDFDGDSILDLVSANERSSSVSLFLGLGALEFGRPREFRVGQQPRFVLPGDFDSDGDIDLVTSNREGRTLTFLIHQSNSLDSATPDYLEGVCTPREFHDLSARAPASSAVDRFVKFILPVRDDPELVPLLFQNTRRWGLHIDFLREALADEFPSLSDQEYNNLVGLRATRQYYVGAIFRLFDEDGSPLYGFNLFARFDREVERLSLEEVQDIHDRIRAAFQLEPFAYFPTSVAARELAEEWRDQNPGFDIFLGDTLSSEVSCEAYTQGVGYGRVRRLSPEEFEAANDRGELSFQDILVLEEAPRDIAGIVSGVITAEPQGELSHVAIRTARRGTPNAFVRDALSAWAPFEGKLVRLEVDASFGDGCYQVEEANQADAEAFWTTSRPSLSVLPTLDRTFDGLPTLLEIAAMDEGKLPNESRFGGKATNLARLQSVLQAGDGLGGGDLSEYLESGFAIPVKYYLDFIDSNHLPSAFDLTREVSYREYLEELFADEEFQSSPTFRFRALETLRDHMREESVVDSELVTRIASRVEEVLGTPSTRRVRFRSSSNVEDAIEFNGAGLYESTSGCPQDDLDDDDIGPSHCDPSREKERGITRALRRVWSSLWNFGAYEERAFYGIPQHLAAMGILVNRAFIDEAAQGVAFTGNPSNPCDRRYIITAQAGEESVVSPEPGILAEKTLLQVVEGEVVSIDRAVESTLLPPGTYVLAEEKLKELGSLMWHIDQTFPVEAGDYPRSQILLDFEFKLLEDGELAVKQVRPFLLPEPPPEPPIFELTIPAGTVACGAFRVGRDLPTEYRLKSVLQFVGGKLQLPTDVGGFEAELFEQVLLGPAQEEAVRVGPGVFRVDTVSESGSCGGRVTYRFEYEQEFETAAGARLQLKLRKLDFQTEEGSAVELSQELTEEAILDDDRLLLQGSVEDAVGIAELSFSSCGYSALPVWQVTYELADGSRVYLKERFEALGFVDSAPAALTRADVELRGNVREVTSYWDLVYKATRHNRFVEYWVAFRPPLELEGVDRPVHILELVAPEPISDPPVVARAAYLDENLERIVEVEAVSYERKEAVDREQLFLRGDVDADGRVEVADALAILRNLFARTPAPPCLKAADANDDGHINLTDGVTVLLHLLRGQGPLPGPFSACGLDPTADGLSCESFAACP